MNIMIKQRWLMLSMAGFVGMSLNTSTVYAQSIGSATSGKLLLTGGVSQVEGAAGGGLTPWAVIGGYGTRDQVGAGAFYTHVDVDDFSLDSYGVMVGLYDRLELSLAQQSFNTRDVGTELGLGQDFRINQNIYGAKLRLFGDAVLDQDTWVPQVALGVQHKRNDRGELVQALGAQDHTGTDYYLSATKLFLSQSLLLNTTLRYTKANQFGILGFGGDRDSGYSLQPEFSVAYLVTRNVAIGAEYRTKPNNLNVAEEEDAYDVFVAWAPTKHVSLTAAYVHLGNVVVGDQSGVYGSVQFSF